MHPTECRKQSLIQGDMCLHQLHGFRHGSYWIIHHRERKRHYITSTVTWTSPASSHKQSTRIVSEQNPERTRCIKWSALTDKVGVFIYLFYYYYHRKSVRHGFVPEAQWQVRAPKQAWLPGMLTYLLARADLKAICLGHASTPLPPTALPYKRLIGGPWLLIFSRSNGEGESFSSRVDLKSAAMFNLQKSGRRTSVPRDRS